MGQDTHDRALALAARVLDETKTDRDAIERCFQLALSRPPTPKETDAFLSHWEAIEAALPEKGPRADLPPTELVREDVDEFTGEAMSFVEKLFSNEDFVPDLQPADVDRRTRALSDLCHVLLNTNEFIYVY